MTRIARTLTLLCTLVATFTLVGCTSNASKGGRPAVLRFAYIPAADQLQNAKIDPDKLGGYLSKQLHMPVEVVRVEGYAPTIEAMRAHKVDLAFYGALSYIIASQKAGAEAIVSRGFADGSIGGYHSVIAVPSSSPIHSLADLKARASETVFAFTDPASTSGNLYPRAGLLGAGIDPEKDFKKVLFAGTHPETVMAVESGKVDAGAFMATVAQILAEGHRIPPDSVRVIWTSDTIPNTAISVRKDLPDQLKKDIQSAFVDLPKNDPSLNKSLQDTFGRFASGNVWVRVNDASYDGLRKKASQVKDFNIAEGK